jgi:2-haloacid dehalogenase
VKDWPAFSDSAGALQYLKRHYKLVILSNVDNESFAASSKKLAVDFDAVYTAEDIGSYKGFGAAIERSTHLGL